MIGLMIPYGQSQGILGEMLCDIRDTYLSNHPETIVQELVYRTKQPSPVKPDHRITNLTPSRDVLIRSTNQPELGSLIGVSRSTNEMGSTPNLALRIPSSSQLSLPAQNFNEQELHGVPHDVLNRPLPLANTANTDDSQGVHNDNAWELHGVPSNSLRPTEQMDVSMPIQMTPMQAALVSISQAEN